MERSRWARIAGGLAVVLAVAVGGWAATGGLAAPVVQDVSTEWGRISADTAEIRVAVEIENSNPIGVPPLAHIGYRVTMNDVVVADGRTRPIGLSPGTNRIAFGVQLRSDRIADWWVTHINRDERSRLTLASRVVGPLGLGVALPPERQPIETAFLESFGLDEPTTVLVDGEPFLRISDGAASWGRSTPTETPLVLSATLTNLHSAPITIDGFGYVIRMNDVTLGEGRNLDRFEVPPGQTRQLTLAVAMDTPKISAWWVSHLRRGEVTDLTVTISALAESTDGTLVAVDLVNQTSTVRTDLLGTGEATVEGGSTEPALEVFPPAVLEQSMRWGDVTDETTEIETTIGIDNPNPDSPLSDLLALVIDQHVAVNGVTIADTSSTVAQLPSGRGTIMLSTPLDNSRVPEWWARHLNRGETSTMTVRTDGRVDVNFTTFPIDVQTREQTFSTDLLAGLNRNQATPVSVGGSHVLTLRSSTATWGPATAATAPVTYAARIENDADRNLIISEITYVVAINGIGLANDTVPDSWTVPPGTTEVIEFTMVLDNSKMDRWWVTHVRNGESSTLTVEIVATVEANGETARVPLGSSRETVTTDLLGTA